MSTERINEAVKNRPAGVTKREAKRQIERELKAERKARHVPQVVVLDDPLIRNERADAKIIDGVRAQLPDGVTWKPETGQVLIDRERSDAGEHGPTLSEMVALIQQVRGVDRVVTVTDIATEIGVSRATANEWTHRPDFPVPAGELGGSRYWEMNEVWDWRERTKRGPGRPAKS